MVLNPKCPECTREELDSNDVPANARSVSLATYKDCPHRVQLGFRSDLGVGCEFSDRSVREFEHFPKPPYRVCPECARQDPPPENIWVGLLWEPDAEPLDDDGLNQRWAPHGRNRQLIFCPGEDSERVLGICRDAAEGRPLWSALTRGGADTDDIMPPVRVIPIGRGRHHGTDDDMEYMEEDGPPHYCAEPGPVRSTERGQARRYDSDIYAYSDDDSADTRFEPGPRQQLGRTMPTRDIRSRASNDAATCPCEDDAGSEFDPRPQRQLSRTMPTRDIRRGAPNDVDACLYEDDDVSEFDPGPRRRLGARAMPPTEIRRSAPNVVDTCPYEDDADTEFDDLEPRRRLGLGNMRIRRGTLREMEDGFIRPHGRLHGARYRPAPPGLRSRRDRGGRQFDEYDHECCDCYDCQLYH